MEAWETETPVRKAAAMGLRHSRGAETGDDEENGYELKQELVSVERRAVV